MSNLLRLTVCTCLLAPPGLHAQIQQQPPPADQFVYGTYNIQSSGDSGPITISSDANSRTVREESEQSSWQLTFSRSGTENVLTTHVVHWHHQLDYTQLFKSGSPARIVTSTQTDAVLDVPSGPGSLTLHWETDTSGLTYRQLNMSGGDPFAKVKTTVIITKYDANGKVIGAPDVRPPAGAAYRADDLEMHLVLSWQAAQWSNGYSGSLTALDNYKEYIAPNSKDPWLTVKAQWNLHP